MNGQELYGGFVKRLITSVIAFQAVFPQKFGQNRFTESVLADFYTAQTALERAYKRMGDCDIHEVQEKE